MGCHDDALQALHGCTTYLAAMSSGDLQSDDIQSAIRAILMYSRDNGLTVQAVLATTEMACAAVRQRDLEDLAGRAFHGSPIAGPYTSSLSLWEAYWAYKRSDHATFELRIMSLLLAYQAKRKHNGKESSDTSKRVIRTGYWYLEFLQSSPGPGLGALLLLGDSHSVFGNKLPLKHVAFFAQGCISIQGFKSKAIAFSPLVKQSLIKCAERFGLEIQPTSALGKLMALENDCAPVSQTLAQNISVGDDIRASTRALLRVLNHFVGFELPSDFLSRAFNAQCRWDLDGHKIDVPPQSAGIVPDFAAFRNASILSEALDSLQTLGLVDRRHGSLVVQPLAKQHFYSNDNTEEQEIWRKQAVLLVCHAFPRGQTLDSRYRSVGECLIPLWHYARQTLVQGDTLLDWIATTLSASPFTSFRTGTYACRHLASQPFNYVHAWAVRQMLHETPWQEAKGIRAVLHLTKFTLKKAALPENRGAIRINAQIGRLRAQWATVLSRYRSVDEAEAILRPWEPLEVQEPCEMERAVIDRIDLVKARLLRYRGKDQEALTRMAALEKTSQLNEDAFRADLVLNLSELTLSPQRVEELPRGVLDLARQRIYIALGLADEAFQGNDLATASVRYQEAAAEIHSPTLYVRALIGIAKTNHLQDPSAAVWDWCVVKHWMREFKWSEGFAYGLVEFSLGVLTGNNEQEAAGWRMLEDQKFAKWLVGGSPWIARLCQRGQPRPGETSVSCM